MSWLREQRTLRKAAPALLALLFFVLPARAADCPQAWAGYQICMQDGLRAYNLSGIGGDFSYMKRCTDERERACSSGSQASGPVAQPLGNAALQAQFLQDRVQALLSAGCALRRGPDGNPFLRDGAGEAACRGDPGPWASCILDTKTGTRSCMLNVAETSAMTHGAPSVMADAPQVLTIIPSACRAEGVVSVYVRRDDPGRALVRFTGTGSSSPDFNVAIVPGMDAAREIEMLCARARVETAPQPFTLNTLAGWMRKRVEVKALGTDKPDARAPAARSAGTGVRG
jgi:hypothetical protein